MAAVEEQTILSIDVIRTDGGTQPRATLNYDTIRDYAQDMLLGDRFPPVAVYYDGTDYWLTDGFHRYHAVKQMGRDVIDADIKQGTRRDAVWASLSVNKSHGLRRTNEDKQKAVLTALSDSEWTMKPNTIIAKHCGVDEWMVRKYRAELSSGIPKIDASSRIIERNGTTYTMNTGNIGQHMSQPTTPPPTIFEPAPYIEEDEPDTEPSIPVYTSPRYEAPTWTPTLPPSPVPTPAPMPASLYSTYTEEDEGEGREETIEGCDCHTVDTGETTEYYHHHNGLTPDAIQCDKEERDHFMPLMSSSETPEWYTPLSIIERVQSFFGEIDLDPCSNSHEAPNVPARTLYTKDDNGLTQSWYGSTYMNPPYGGEISKWVKKLLDEYESGNVKEAIALVPGRIDTAWFQPLYEHLICAIKGRVQFIGASTNSAPFPSVAVYLGPRKEDFIHTFKDMGPIVTRIA